MDAIPLKAFIALLTQGIASPRPVVRRIIAAQPDGVQRLMLVALGAAMQGLVWALVGLIAPGADAVMGIGGLLALMAISFVNYAITASLAFNIGRRFGGKGAAAEVATAVAWHAVLTGALAPLQVLALGGATGTPAVGGGGVLFLLFYAGLNVWLLASCVAEAHRFVSTGRVLGATLALFLALGLILSLLLSGLRA